MQENTVTIGIITHNRIKYLPTAINSALEQCGGAVKEILVVNDGSSDGTQEYLSSLADKRVKVINQENKQGRSSARNMVIKSMSGNWLMWLDDDDVIVPDAVSKSIEFINAHPDADVVYCDHIASDDNLKPKHITPSMSYPSEQMLMHMMYENFIRHGASMIRRRVFDRIGGYDNELDRGEDHDVWVRALIAGFKFYHNNQALYCFRYHQDNVGNPQVTREQSKYHCRIVQRALSLSKLEIIFPLLDWNKDPQGSAAVAMILLTRIFFDHGDDQSALECIDYSLEFKSLPIARMMRGLILRMMNRDKEALETFIEVVKDAQPDLAAFCIPVGTARGSYAN